MRVLKRIIYGLFYLAILGGVGFLAFRFVVPAPVCSDGVKNGLELGVDCGPVCGNLCNPEIQPLQVKKVHILPAADRYDIMAEVFNPNMVYGSSDVQYELIVKDAQGESLFSDIGTFYILPNQTRFLPKVALRLARAPATAELTIRQANWQLVKDNAAVDFTVRKEQYVDNGPAGAAVDGRLANNTTFDFGRVDVVVTLSDSSGQIIAVNPSVITTFTTGSERGFLVTWPFQISVPAPTIHMYATTNVFENSNFIKTYGSPEKFEKR